MGTPSKAIQTDEILYLERRLHAHDRGKCFRKSQLAWLLEDASSKVRLTLKVKEYGGVCVDRNVLLKLALRVPHKYVYMVRKGIDRNSFQGSSLCICLYWVG
jgi:hypothetical protein